MRSIIIVAMVIVQCVVYSKALQCYTHSLCSSNCPQLSNTITTCSTDDNKCYKAAPPGGIMRGCTRDRCNILVDTNAIMPKVCCETNLCNSARTQKMAFSSILSLALVLILLCL